MSMEIRTSTLFEMLGRQTALLELERMETARLRQEVAALKAQMEATDG